MAASIDARTWSGGPELSADVCIIGAGAAGVTLAANLERSGLSVLLLEAGGRELDGPTQALYKAEQTGLKYYDMTSCRLRYYGGTTNHWAGYCRENDPIDYEGRSSLGVPAWPVGYDEIRPFVVQAQHALSLKPEGFDVDVAAVAHGVNPADLLERHSPDLMTKVFQIVQRRKIVELFPRVLNGQANVTVMLHANVTHLQLGSDGKSVQSAVVRTLNNRTFTVKAIRYVLCAHAVENARLLMASNDVLPQGIGNQHDHVGRYFMEHAQMKSGLMYPLKGFAHFYDYSWARRRHVNANLSLTAQALRREGILQYYCRFRPIYGHEEVSRAMNRLRSRFWRPGDLESVRQLAIVLGDMPQAARFVTSRALDRPPRPLAFELDHRIEQAPNPQSRVLLTDERDALGMRKVILNWRLNEVDYRTFAKGQELIVREFTRLGMARFTAPPIQPEQVRGVVKGHFHHIGTTRMSDDARSGVVDRNGRVHGVANLYVGGSSVFPSAGYSGPTMMIIAFAMRMASHLSSLGRRT